jgi:hypothetical protein
VDLKGVGTFNAHNSVACSRFVTTTVCPGLGSGDKPLMLLERGARTISSLSRVRSDFVIRITRLAKCGVFGVCFSAIRPEAPRGTLRNSLEGSKFSAGRSKIVDAFLACSHASQRHCSRA